jgi:F420-dependent oxidoreductase-like protein
MREIGIGVAVMDTAGTGLETQLERIRVAEDSGFQSVWIPSVFGVDALTLAALASRQTRTLEIGTAVVLTHSRHPLYMAQQALTTQAAAGGRFVLGLGPSHKIVIEDMLGLSYQRPARHVREYVTVVKELMDGGKTSFHGETQRVNASLNVTCDAPPPVLIGALGPLMRKIAGAVADGTITWMTGPRMLGETLVPEIRAAAEQAGRPSPRIVAGFPVALTNDTGAAREAAGRILAFYGNLPSYRATLDAEGVEGPADMAIAGDEKAIEEAIRGLASVGVTDFNASIFPCGPDAKASIMRTHEFLSELAKS